MNTLKLFWQRLLSPTPNFWKKVIKLGAVLTAVGMGLLVTPDNPYVVIPDFLQHAGGYLVTAGFLISLIAKATTTDNDLSNK